MIVTVTDVVNLAYGNLFSGAKIRDLNEPTPEAQEALLHYDIALEATLADHPWGFASREARLVLASGEESLSWEFAYAYPQDCAVMRQVFDGQGRRRPFSPAMISNGRRGVFTDAVDAWGCYTVRSVSPHLMPAQFVEAFSWRLALELAQGHLADQNAATLAAQSYAVQLELAKKRDALESSPLPPRECEWLRARHV